MNLNAMSAPVLGRTAPRPYLGYAWRRCCSCLNLCWHGQGRYRSAHEVGPGTGLARVLHRIRRVALLELTPSSYTENAGDDAPKLPLRNRVLTSAPVQARPAATSGERRSLDSAEISKLLTAAGRRHKALIAVGAFSGLRISEALGLTWEDIDFEDGAIRVRKQLGRDGKRVAPKTARAVRSVVLFPRSG
jgi:integrase